MIIDKVCSICLIDSGGESYLEGHYHKEGHHLFDPSCIRTWINIHADCPLCRHPLTAVQLIRVKNPDFTRGKQAYKWINKTQETICWATKKVLPLAFFGGSTLAMAYTTLSMMKVVAPQFVAGLLSGSEDVLASALVTVLPMIQNKIKGHHLINQRNIQQIYVLSIAVAAILAISSQVEDINTTMGIIAGAAISASLAGLTGESPFFREGGIIQIEPIPNGFTNSNKILGLITSTSAFTVANIALGKFAWSYTKEWGLLVQAVSAVFGGTLSITSLLTIDAINNLVEVRDHE